MGAIWRLKQTTRTGNAVPIDPRRAEVPAVRGYRMIRMGKNRSILAHRAVFVALKGELLPDQELNHKDGQRANNAPGNLEIATRQENCQHSYSVLGRSGMSGERNGGSKLTAIQVQEVRSLQGKMPSRKVGLQFGISHNQVLKIWNGDAWKGMPEVAHGLR